MMRSVPMESTGGGRMTGGALPNKDMRPDTNVACVWGDGGGDGEGMWEKGIP